MAGSGGDGVLHSFPPAVRQRQSIVFVGPIGAFNARSSGRHRPSDPQMDPVARKSSRLLYFSGFVGRFFVPRDHPFIRTVRVLNSMAAGRRLAQRVAVAQVAATLATALACLIWGAGAGLAALAGGLSMALGSALAGWSAFGGAVAGGGMLLGRLLLGTALKWIVVALGLYLAIGRWGLPAPAVLAGAVSATLAWFLTAGRQQGRHKVAGTRGTGN